MNRLINGIDQLFDSINRWINGWGGWPGPSGAAANKWRIGNYVPTLNKTTTRLGNYRKHRLRDSETTTSRFKKHRISTRKLQTQLGNYHSRLGNYLERNSETTQLRLRKLPIRFPWGPGLQSTPYLGCARRLELVNESRGAAKGQPCV